MLLINVKAGQSVLVGKTHRLTVLSINEDTFLASLRYYTPAAVTMQDVKVGVLWNVAKNVNVTMTRINLGRDVSVTLGFDAPRRIQIRGEWVGERNKRTDYVTLKGLPPQQLITLAEKEVQTDLERILLDTLKLVY